MAKIKKKKIIKVAKKPAKKVAIKSKKSLAKIQNKPVGKITHYFSNIKVAVIKLKNPLKDGDKIKITGGESTNFEQVVKSMQIDHKPVKAAKKGKSVGLKVNKKVREGYLVFKV